LDACAAADIAVAESFLNPGLADDGLVPFRLIHLDSAACDGKPADGD
jgi:hypothetical protein